MPSSHPFEKLEPRTNVLLFIISLLITIALSITLNMWGHVLIHDRAPYGILSFEFVWSLEGLHRVIGPWNDAIQQAAIEITLVDFLYILAYATMLTTAALIIKRKAQSRNNPQVTKVALLAAWFPAMAAFCDIVENLCGLRLLLYDPVNPWPMVMGIMAAVKFLLIIDVLLFLVFSSLWLIATRKRAP